MGSDIWQQLVVTLVTCCIWGWIGQILLTAPLIITELYLWFCIHYQLSSHWTKQPSNTIHAPFTVEPHLWPSAPPTAFQLFPGPRPRCGPPGGRCCGSWRAQDPPCTAPLDHAAPGGWWSPWALPRHCHHVPTPVWGSKVMLGYFKM